MSAMFIQRSIRIGGFLVAPKQQKQSSKKCGVNEMKTKFVMSKEQLNKILEASKPVRYMIFNGMEPRSPQENANDCWKELGDEMGFVWDTAEPGENQLTFYAEAK